MKDTEFIIKYWVLENSTAVTERTTGALIGDGRFEIVFVTGEGYKTIRPNGVEHIKAGIYIGGQMDDPMDLAIAPNTKLHALKIEPWVAQLLSGFNFFQALNRTVPLKEVNRTLAQKLREFDPDSQMTRIRHELLIYLENTHQNTRDFHVLKSCCTILDRGYMDFRFARDHYLNAVGLTTRSIENKFKRAIGLSPQQYANGIRLRRVSEDIRLGSKLTTYTNLAHQHGFYDQAHFNRLFKSYWGFAPGEMNAADVFITDSAEHFRYYTI